MKLSNQTREEAIDQIIQTQLMAGLRLEDATEYERRVRRCNDNMLEYLLIASIEDLNQYFKREYGG